jgi:hypothetical protein
MLQHASIDTFIKHYLPRRVTADTRAIVSGYEPQHDLMRAACRMTRWIDPDRPQELTLEQSQSVNEHPRIRQLVAQREKWKRRFTGTATKQPGYRILSREIVSERLRQRTALLKQLQKTWDLEHPVNEVELQLSGLKFDQDVKTTLDLADDMPPVQRRLAETMMTLPGTTLEEEFRRRNAAINAVAAYCKFQEGGAAARPRGRPPTGKASPIPINKTNQQLVAAEPWHQAFNMAMRSVYQEKRPTICFLCLGNQNLPMSKRIHSFSTPGDLSKHFRRKHISNLKEGEEITCNLCKISLQHKMHLQNHAMKKHGTVS